MPFENPPALPLEGERFSARWNDFIDDREIIHAIEEYKVFITSIVGKRYTKEYLAVTIVLVKKDRYGLEDQQALLTNSSLTSSDV